MTTFLYMLLVFFGSVIATIGVCTVVVHNDNKKRTKLKNFEEEKREILNQIEAEQNAAIRAKNQLLSEISKLKEDYEQKRELAEGGIQALQDEYNKANQHYSEQLKELEKRSMDAIGDVSKKEAEHLQSIQQYYIEQKNLIQSDYEGFLDQIEIEKNALTKTIEKERKTYEEIIEQFKRSEEAKTKQDFYRIVLTQDEISDVKKLKQIAEELHDPSVLYKLIYKTYYERPFNELMGRIGGGKIGIYKITNIENGKVYIGQTKQEFSTRLRTHVKRGLRAEPTTKNKLYNAMWEDGVENFTFEILSECNIDELNEKEKEFIAFFKSTEWGYNSNQGVG